MHRKSKGLANGASTSAQPGGVWLRQARDLGAALEAPAFIVGFDNVVVLGKTAEQGCCHFWIDEVDIGELVELKQHHDMAGYCIRPDVFSVSLCKARPESLAGGEATRAFDPKIGQDAEAASTQAIKTTQVEIGQLTDENDLLARRFDK